jgi:putative membrane protein
MSASVPGENRTGGLKSALSRFASGLVGFVRASGPYRKATDAPLDLNTQLSVERTMLAHERTLMAWVRTATSLITFGFTIYKFFQLEAKGHVPVAQVIGPRTFALLMIAMGLFALLVATLQHRQYMKGRGKYAGVAQRSLAGLVAGLISLLGLTAMISVIFDW